MGGVSGEVLLARAFLSRVAEPACIALWDAVRRNGPVETVAAIRDGTAHPDVLAATASRAAGVDPDADLAVAARHGIRLVVPESDEWPHFAMSCLEATGLIRAARWHAGERRVADYGEPIPPLALWVRGVGDLCSLGVQSAGIVGARAATAYGEHVAAELSSGMAGRGFVIVSGGAHGIDATAHRAALAVGGETVIVSAGGLDQAYPPANAPLFERVADAGLIVSESPPGAAPQRRRFLTRNRLIAALATGTVVVEAAKRSGAMNTAGHCGRMSRPIMAVPGPVTSAMSAGCHLLLSMESEPATLVTSVADILMVIGRPDDVSAQFGASDVAKGTALQKILDILDVPSRQVYDGLPARRAVQVDELAFASGLSAVHIMRALPVLELHGLVEAVGSGYRRLQRGRPASGCTP